MEITADNVYLVIAILTTLFSAFLFFRKPQEDLDKRQALTDQEVDNKALIIAQQFQWEKEINAQRFADMQVSIREATALAQNHIHTIDTKVDGLQKSIEQLGKDMVRLSTLIEERDSHDRRRNPNINN